MSNALYCTVPYNRIVNYKTSVYVDFKTTSPLLLLVEGFFDTHTKYILSVVVMTIQSEKNWHITSAALI